MPDTQIPNPSSHTQAELVAIAHKTMPGGGFGNVGYDIIIDRGAR